jgi:osmotically-inducible protein OsmY
MMPVYDFRRTGQGGFAMIRLIAAAFAALCLAAAPATAQLLEILTAPKTLIERAVEDRSLEDIGKDNAIVLEVNALMAEIRNIQASTAIYEQRLLITGLFDNKADYDKFHAGVKKVKDVKKLYWHAVYMPIAEQKKRKKAKKMKSWVATLAQGTKAEALLAASPGISHTNYRTPVDVLGTLYLLGRALSKAERDKAVATMKGMKGPFRVVSYVEVRPKKK